MREFTSVDSFQITGKGTAYVTHADRVMDMDHPDLVGQVVLLDGIEVEVIGVERRMIRPPIQEGEPISLLVRSIRERP